jgi:uncharacterized protein (TIGR02246 family)
MRNSNRTSIALAAALFAAACGAQASGGGHGDAPSEDHAVVVTVAQKPSREEIAALFDIWNETLQTGGPHDMALLYAEDGVLLPTASNDVRTNRVEIADYFAHFLELHPRGVINEQYIDILDPNTAVSSGVYTFDVIKRREPTYVVARYSFIYEKIGGKWLIKSHHSSAMPEAIAQRPTTLVQKFALHGAIEDAEASVGAATGAVSSASASDHGAGHH